MFSKKNSLFLILLTLFSLSSLAQLNSTKKDSTNTEIYKYFQKRKPLTKIQRKNRQTLFKKNHRGKLNRRVSSEQAPHFLTIYSSLPKKINHFGLSNKDSVVKEIYNFGLSYRFGYWADSADFLLKINYLQYSLTPKVTDADPSPLALALQTESEKQKTSQIAFLPTIIFPDSASNFPIYVGGSTGFGFFLEQVKGRPKTSFNYEIFTGLRFFDILSSWGFFVEFSQSARFLFFPDGKYQNNSLSIGIVSRF